MPVSVPLDSPLAPWLLKLEDSAALDGLVDAVRPLMDAVTQNPSVKRTLEGRPMGHAAHPALVQLPLGAWLSALLLDVARPHADEDGRGAQLLTGVGLAAALPSVLSGLAELAHAGRREQRVGVVHAASNAAGIALQAVSLVQRSAGVRGPAAVTAGLAMTALGVGGYLGGHLAVAREVGTKDPAFHD